MKKKLSVKRDKTFPLLCMFSSHMLVGNRNIYIKDAEALLGSAVNSLQFYVCSLQFAYS